GAVVGGSYVAGKLDNVEEWARAMTQRRLFRFLDFGIGSGGLLQGKKLAAELNDALGDLEIQHLGRRFVAVTTELATGHEIWLRQGHMVEAMRASYALPGIFTPVKVEGRWLIDGALVNPVPVSTCRAFGARLVIAVNLNADIFGMGTVRKGDRLESDEELDAENAEARSMLAGARLSNRMAMRQLLGTTKGTPGLTTVMFGAFNIVQDRLARSRLAGDPPDVLVNPPVAHIGLLDFHRAEESIKLGEQAMVEAIPMIHEALSVLN
ncbi:MAG: patatin-like phospholipase family protein, partial [Alphaproteobacteria bacterium]|nr:patatin-like phospholipase family protein [Alphaproteobacteria bacterium]